MRNTNECEQCHQSEPAGLWSSQDLVDSSIQVVAEGDADVHQSERGPSPVDV